MKITTPYIRRYILDENNNFSVTCKLIFLLLFAYINVWKAWMTSQFPKFQPYTNYIRRKMFSLEILLEHIKEIKWHPYTRKLNLKNFCFPVFSSTIHTDTSRRCTKFDLKTSNTDFNFRKTRIKILSPQKSEQIFGIGLRESGIRISSKNIHFLHDGDLYTSCQEVSNQW